ncbi:MAG: hypothetical protein ACK41V_14320 [Acidovorax sp.]
MAHEKRHGATAALSAPVLKEAITQEIKIHAELVKAAELVPQ